MGTIFGALPGWWLGADDGRAGSPCVSPQEWDRLLRATGFSGCDTVTPVHDGYVMPLSVFVSQAVDIRVDFLRKPLSSSLSLFGDAATSDRQELILLGGSSSSTSRLIKQLMSILSLQWKDKIIVAHSMDDIRPMAIASTTTVLSLLDLDHCVLANTSRSNWESLKLLLQAAGTVMWVSSGRRAQNPHANMMVGLLRATRLEHPALAVQCFDSEAERGFEAENLAEAFLRFKATVEWQRQAQNNTLLTTVEPEIVLEQDGTMVLPRVVESSDMNARYNSSRRQIISDVRGLPIAGNLEIVGSELQHTPDPGDDGRSTVHVTHSLRSIIRVSASSCAQLVLGRNSETDAQVVALAAHSHLKVVPYTQILLPEPVQSGRESAFVALIAHHVVADLFLEGLALGSKAIIYDSGVDFATVVAEEAKRRGVDIIFITASKTTIVDSNWITIHPRVPDRTLRRLLPTNLTAMLDFSREGEKETVGSRLRVQLPKNCRYETIGSFLFRDAAWTQQNALGPDAHTRLSDCVARSLMQLTDFKFRDSALTPDISDSHLGSQIAHAVLDWTKITSHAPVRACSAESQVRFSDHRTYWLAGLSGGLGLLLCEWMVRRGAKYVVISSRAPSVDEAWLEKMEAAGAVVKIYAWFVPCLSNLNISPSWLELTLE